MKEKTRTILWAVLGLLAGVLAIALILTGLYGSSLMKVSVPEIQASARSMVDTLKSGDLESLGQQFYGSPKLDSFPKEASEAEQIIWQAYLDSLDCQVGEDITATEKGVSLSMSITCLDIPSLMDTVKATTPALLEQKVSAAEDDTLIYDDAHNYRADFLEVVLAESVKEALTAQSGTQEHLLTLECRSADGHWKILPTAQVQAMLCGFVTEEG